VLVGVPFPWRRLGRRPSIPTMPPELARLASKPRWAAGNNVDKVTTRPRGVVLARHVRRQRRRLPPCELFGRFSPDYHCAEVLQLPPAGQDRANLGSRDPRPTAPPASPVTLTEAMNLLVESVRRTFGLCNIDRLRLLLACGVKWQTPPYESVA
jgi:hypothetical protein